MADPTWLRPSPQECQAAVDALVALHGAPGRPTSGVAEAEGLSVLTAGCDVGSRSVLDSLVRTMLSQNTTDITSGRAFASLKKLCPTWEEARTMPAARMEDAIRVGGLAEVKVQRIKFILHTLHKEQGDVSLESLRQLSTDEVKAQLTRFPGVGPKTVACVLMFCLHRAEFPVDTHVWVIAKRLGWVRPTASREAAYAHLNARVPDNLKYDLHVLLVTHGKVCGACAKSPKAAKKGSPPCPLTTLKAALSVQQEAASPPPALAEPCTSHAAAPKVSKAKQLASHGPTTCSKSGRKQPGTQLSATEGTECKAEQLVPHGTVRSKGPTRKRPRTESSATQSVENEAKQLLHHSVKVEPTVKDELVDSSKFSSQMQCKVEPQPAHASVSTVKVEVD